MKALILAAGYATRLYPLTKNHPKPLLKIGDRTIADFMLERISEISAIDQVFVVTNARFHRHFSEWASTIAEQSPWSFEITIVNDETTSNENRLGAIADIQFVLSKHPADEDWLITAGDNIFQFDFAELYAFFREKDSSIILAHPVESREKLRRAGVVELDTDSRVIGFEEKPDEPKSNLIAPAVYILKKSHLSLIPEYLAANASSDAPGHFISWLYRRVPIYAYVMEQKYYDIGTLEMYHQVRREFV